MTVSTIASIAAGVTRSLSSSTGSSGSASIASSVASLLTASGGGDSSSDSLSSSLSNITALQSQLASLRAVTQSVAQTGALVSTAQGGVSEIAKALDRMQDLSQQASDANLSTSERASLDQEFQSLRDTINRIANDTSFGDQKLLDGSLDSQALQQATDDSNSTDDDGFQIASLTDASLFGTGDDVNLLSASSAQNASQLVSSAQNTVATQAATLDSLGQGIDLAFGSLQTASQNQDAASSFLTDDDLLSASTGSQQAQMLQQATAALQAQTSKLPGNILSLLAE